MDVYTPAKANVVQPTRTRRAAAPAVA